MRGPTATAALEEHVPYFLVSHARGDDDAYVQEFFHDLCRSVAALTGIPGRTDVGVLATDQDGGAEGWSASVAGALTRCQVFLPLCSPRFLLSESAGRLWWIYRERLRRFRDETGQDAPSLMPLRWSAIRDLPDGFPGFVPVEPGAPRRPLRQYLRLRGLRPQYRSFIDRLATQIVKTARANPLPAYRQLPAPARIPNAFAPSETGLTAPLVSGVRNVRFVVAAGSRDDMELIRAELDYYGKDSTEWAPYRPADSRPLADHAQAIAAGRLFGSEVTDLKDLRRTLEQARAANDLVVLLVDPWSTRVPDSRRRLSDADRAGLPDTAVLVPVNSTDLESERMRDELMFDVAKTLAGFLGRPDVLYSGRLPTPESFDNQLAATLEEGRNRMFRAGRQQPPDQGPSTGQRPILCGP